MFKVLFFLLLVRGDLPKSSELQLYRSEYQRIHLSEEAVSVILKTAGNTTLTGTSAQAYAAAAVLCSAKYKPSPIAALQEFNKGKRLLELAISKDTSNVDARFLRYTIQLKAPSFLAYTSNCNADRNYLLSKLPQLRRDDPQMFAIIQSFMIVHDNKARKVIHSTEQTN